MSTELEDFIYSCAEFNSCEFCTKFGFAKSCPVKSAYKGDKYPSKCEIEENANICKKFVISSLVSLLKK